MQETKERKYHENKYGKHELEIDLKRHRLPLTSVINVPAVGRGSRGMPQR